LEQNKRKIPPNAKALWKLKSREIWLESGDLNMKYFHNFLNSTKKQNTIWEVQRDDGSKS